MRRFSKLCVLGVVVIASCAVLMIWSIPSTPFSKAKASDKDVYIEFIGQIPLMPGRSGASIPALYRPLYVKPKDVDWLNPSDLVVGVEFGGEARAYPTKILHWHEIVNDSLGGQALLVTYCPLAGSALAFLGRTKEGVLTFRVADVLYESTLVMRDDQTQSLWYQLRGEAIKGPLKGLALTPVKTLLCTWEHWFSRHPTTHVLGLPTVLGTNYLAKYQKPPLIPSATTPSLPDFPVVYLDETRPAKERVWGVRLEERTIVFPFSSLAQEGEARLQCNRGTLIVSLNQSAECATATLVRDGTTEAVATIACYWFAWKAAYWKSEVWNGR